MAIMLVMIESQHDRLLIMTVTLMVDCSIAYHDNHPHDSSLDCCARLSSVPSLILILLDCSQSKVEKTVALAVEAEASRSRRELAMLREAAAADVSDAHREGRALVESLALQLDREREEWGELQQVWEEKARMRRERHAARVGEVIASEEECQKRCDALEEALREAMREAEGTREEGLAREQQIKVLVKEMRELDAALQVRNSTTRTVCLSHSLWRRPRAERGGG